MKKFKIILSRFLILLLLTPMAYAQTSKKADTDTEPAVIVEVKATPAPVVIGQPFTVPGNGDVLDNVDDDSKEFYIITTANNNTFYLVIDKASTSKNVYMLSKVDENDLAEFIEDGRTAVQPTPTPGASIIIQQPTIVPPVTETPSVIVPVEDNSKSDTAKLIVILAILGIGAIVYFKVIKPKKDATVNSGENMEHDG